MEKHTPGPWLCEEDPLRALTWRTVAGGIAAAAVFYALGWLVWTAFGPV